MFVGDTDETLDGKPTPPLADEFDRLGMAVVKDMFGGGVSLPWNLAICAAIGLFLLFTRVALGVDGNLAHAHHVIGSLVMTVVSVAAAEVARAVRFLNVPLGLALMGSPFVFASSSAVLVVSVLLGALVVVLSWPRGPIKEKYGNWDRMIA